MNPVSSIADLGWNEVWRQEVTDNVNQVVVVDNSRPMNGTWEVHQ